MFCEKCGNNVEAESAFCYQCGNPMPRSNNSAGQYNQSGRDGNNYGYGHSPQNYNYGGNTFVSDYGSGINGKSALKWIALALAVAAFIFHIFAEFSYKRITNEDHYDYWSDFSDYSEYTSSFFGSNSLLIFVYIIFVIYIGCLFAGRSNRTLGIVRRVFQIAYFGLMFLLPVLMVVSVYTSVDEDVTIKLSLEFGWWLTVAFGFIGLAVSIIPED